jgi:hypothetical protein
MYFKLERNFKLLGIVLEIIILICCVNFSPHAIKFKIVKSRIEALTWLWTESTT